MMQQKCISKIKKKKHYLNYKTNTTMITIKPNLFIKKETFNAGGDIKFPLGYAMPADFVEGTPVAVVIVLPGIGEAIDAPCSIQSCMNRGFFYVDEKNYSFFAAACVWPIVFVVVQSTKASAFRNGEIQFAVDQAKKRFNVMRLAFFGISQGGFGACQWIDTKEKAAMFDYGFFDMPGGNGNVGFKFPSAARDAGLECMFFHAQDDTTALPKQSIMLHEEINILHGKSTLLLYEKGGHGITTTAMNAWGDNMIIEGLTYSAGNLWNDGSRKVVAQSDKPNYSIYDKLFEKPIIKDKLLMVQGIWQRPDGSVYAKEYVPE